MKAVIFKRTEILNCKMLVKMTKPKTYMKTIIKKTYTSRHKGTYTHIHTYTNTQKYTYTHVHT